MYALKMANYVPVFDREKCHSLVNRTMKAKTLREAALIILAEAKGLKANDKGMGWKEVFNKIGKALLKGRAGLKIFSDKGNTKLPFVSFSVLPFVTCPGMGDCAKFCYSPRAWRHPGGFACQLQNTLLIKFNNKVIEEAFLKIENNRIVRLYVDGDFDSLKTVIFWMNLLKMRPDLQAYGYSKSWTLLIKYGEKRDWPHNYLLNLSSGGKDQGHTVEDMMKLPIVRNQFVAVKIEYKTGKKGRIGFERYLDPAYHRLVREKAVEMGYGKVFSCPGQCGSCTPNGHACGSKTFKNIVIAIGVH